MKSYKFETKLEMAKKMIKDLEDRLWNQKEESEGLITALQRQVIESQYWLEKHQSEET